MEEIFGRALNNLERKSKVWYRIVVFSRVLLYLGVIVGAALLVWLDYYEKISVKSILKNDILVNIIASFVGVAALFIGVQFVIWLLRRKEDQNKVSYRNQDMWNQYEKKYRTIFSMHGSDFVVYFENLFRKDKVSDIVIQDDPKNFFQLDPYLKAHCSTLLEAHAMSKTTDSVTVRLRDFDPPTSENSMTATIYSGRSSYLAHLLTNRALDYFVDGKLSVRKLFENDKQLRPLSRAMLSNHFGVNALVFLKGKDGDETWLLMPHRSGKATVAKKKVTASIATRLEMDKSALFPNGYEDELNLEFIEKGCVEDTIADSIWVTKEWFEKAKSKKRRGQFMTIRFLGLSRDIYEGGKPTLFYCVHLNMEPKEYLEGRKDWEKNLRNKKWHMFKTWSPYHILKKDRKIDEVKTIHIVKWSTVHMEKVKQFLCFGEVRPQMEYHDTRLDSAKLTFKRLKRLKGEKEILRNKSVEFEQNMIANFWYLQACPELAPSAKVAC